MNYIKNNDSSPRSLSKNNILIFFFLISFLLIAFNLSFASEIKLEGRASFELCRKIANDFVNIQKHRIPAWENAGFDDPLIFCDLHDSVSAYVFPVLNNGEIHGYITVNTRYNYRPIGDFSESISNSYRR